MKKNWKYLMVVILLFAFFLFGKHFYTLSDDKDLVIKTLQKKLENIQKGIYKIDAGKINAGSKIQLTIKTSDSYKKGDPARLFFDIETNDKLLYQPYEKRPIDFSIYLASDYGEEQLIDNVILNVPTKITLREIEFTPEFDASKLVVRRNDSRTTGDLIISNIKSFRLNVGADNLGELRQTISGRTDLSKVVFNTADRFGGRFPLVFTRKEQLFGQVFTSNFEQISSVDLALLWRGTGGSGNYLVELKEVLSNGSYSDALSHYYFDQKTIEDNLIGENVYRVPLAANLVKGKSYMISLNNYNVQFNLINTLGVGSSESKDGEASLAIMTIGGGETKPVERLFIKVNGADCFKFNDSCVLSGAIIQDIGDGTGLYTYESTGESIDFLDLYKYDPNTIFDNLAGGIIAPVKGETSFYYKFDTIYPYKIIKIVFDQNIINVSDNQLFYSFDNENWIPIDRNEDGNLIIERIIKPLSSHQTSLFIKVTYDPDDAEYKQSVLFGMKGIKVQASLVIN